MKRIFFWLFLALVLIDCAYAVEYLNGSLSSLSAFLHGLTVITCIAYFLFATIEADAKQYDGFRTPNFWLMTLTLPAAVGYFLMFVLNQAGLLSVHFADSDIQLVGQGFLFGTLFFVPQIGLLVGWKMIRSLCGV